MPVAAPERQGALAQHLRLAQLVPGHPARREPHAAAHGVNLLHGPRVHEGRVQASPQAAPPEPPAADPDAEPTRRRLASTHVVRPRMHTVGAPCLAAASAANSIWYSRPVGEKPSPCS